MTLGEELNRLAWSDGPPGLPSGWTLEATTVIAVVDSRGEPRGWIDQHWLTGQFIPLTFNETAVDTIEEALAQIVDGSTEAAHPQQEPTTTGRAA